MPTLPVGMGFAVICSAASFVRRSFLHHGQSHQHADRQHQYRHQRAAEVQQAEREQRRSPARLDRGRVPTPSVPTVPDCLATPSKRCALLLSIWDTGMLRFVDAVPSEVLARDARLRPKCPRNDFQHHRFDCRVACTLAYSWACTALPPTAPSPRSEAVPSLAAARRPRCKPKLSVGSRRASLSPRLMVVGQFEIWRSRTAKWAL
jgi:hypothetical protein